VNHKVRIYDDGPSPTLIDDGNKSTSSPVLVITKSTRVVPSGCSGPFEMRSSSRIGRSAEWPGLGEPGNGPRPLAGGDGCLEASIINWSCASPTRIKPGLSNTVKANSNFNRRTASSQQSRMSRLVGGSIARCIGAHGATSVVSWFIGTWTALPERANIDATVSRRTAPDTQKLGVL